MITAAHCLCRDTQDSKKPRFLCVNKEKSQIRPKQNEIKIYGGSASVDNFDFQGHWVADEAFIMDLGSTGIEKEDIGIAVLSDKQHKDNPFFNKDILMAEEELRKAVVVPICLVSKNKDFKKT